MLAWSPLQAQPSASRAIQGIPASPTLPRLWRVLFLSRAPLCIIHRCRQTHRPETSPNIACTSAVIAPSLHASDGSFKCRHFQAPGIFERIIGSRRTRPMLSFALGLCSIGPPFKLNSTLQFPFPVNAHRRLYYPSTKGSVTCTRFCGTPNTMADRAMHQPVAQHWSQDPLIESSISLNATSADVSGLSAAEGAGGRLDLAGPRVCQEREARNGLDGGVLRTRLPLRCFRGLGDHGSSRSSRVTPPASCRGNHIRITTARQGFAGAKEMQPLGSPWC